MDSLKKRTKRFSDLKLKFLFLHAKKKSIRLDVGCQKGNGARKKKHSLLGF